MIRIVSSTPTPDGTDPRLGDRDETRNARSEIQDHFVQWHLSPTRSEMAGSRYEAGGGVR